MAFRGRDLSCTNNLTVLISKIKTANNACQVTGAVFHLDVESAFDNVDPGTLLDILPFLEVSPLMIPFFGVRNKFQGS